MGLHSPTLGCLITQKGCRIYAHILMQEILNKKKESKVSCLFPSMQRVLIILMFNTGGNCLKYIIPCMLQPVFAPCRTQDEMEWEDEIDQRAVTPFMQIPRIPSGPARRGFVPYRLWMIMDMVTRVS